MKRTPAVLLLALGLVGCAPSDVYLKGDEATHAVVAPSWSRYFEADDTLTEPDKQLFRDVVTSWGRRIQQAKR